MHSLSLRLLPRAALVACALAVLALATDFVSAQGQGGGRRLVTEIVDGHEVVAGEVLLRFRDQRRAAIDQARAERDTDADEVEVVGWRGLRRLHSQRHGTRALLAMLRANPDVELAEPNYVIRVGATPNDSFFSLLWGLRNVGQTILGATGVAGADIDATLAWDTQKGSRTAVIGVVDTGIDYNHPDLAANIWSAPSAFTVTIGALTITCPAGSHGFNAITNTCDPMDDHDHGTHVAGTIGAVGNNGIGVAGVNWVASMMGLKFLDATGSGTTDDAIQAIDFAVQAKQVLGGQANVRVLNNSWGGGGYSQELKDAIDRANSSGMLFVAAAGNGGADGVGDNNDITPAYPASYASPNVIAVAATDNRDLRASFSNYGAMSVHLGAPGKDVASTTRNNTYKYFSGTSMATPHVVGAAALVMAECPWISMSDLKTRLLDTVDPIASMAGIAITGGRLNVNRAVRSCAVQSLTVTSNLPAPQFTGTTITFTATATDGRAPYQYKWFRLYNSAVTVLQEWSESNTLVWTPTVSYPYTIIVSVHSAGGPDGAELSVNVPYVITDPPPPVSSVVLTADKTAPQPPGTTVTWTAASAGGVAPHQYKWWVFDGVSWMAVTGWTSSNTFAWTPTATNANYLVAVWVRSAGNPADAADVYGLAPFAISPPAPPVTAVTLSADRSAPQAPGTTITWTAAPTGGATPYQYKWWIYDGAAWTTPGWTGANTFAWTPTVANPNYLVAVWVKSAGKPADAPDVYGVLPFAISSPASPVTAVTLSADRSAPQAPGTTIMWTAASVGGVAPYQYKWWVFDGVSWTAVTGWTGSNTFAWTPTVENASYLVAVWVKSAGNVVDAPDVYGVLPFVISTITPVTAVTLSADRSAPQPQGTTVTWTAASVGGVGPHQYKWWVFDGVSWTAVTGWTGSNTFGWTPTVANASYLVAVWVKSAGNPADAPDVYGVLPFAITSVPPVTAVTVTPDVSAPRASGTTILWTAVPADGVAPHQYKWWVSDGVSWTATGWTTVNTFAWTPTVANANYIVAVWVKSAGNPADAPDVALAFQFPIAP